MRLIRIALAIIFLPAIAHAQTVDRDRGYIGIKGGLNIERAEDNLRGTTGGGGALAGFAVTDDWDLEVEFWRPRALRTHHEDGLHRDTLFGIAVRRAVGAGRVRPHFLIGVALARTFDQAARCAALRRSPSAPEPIEVLVSCDEPDVIDRRLETFTGNSLVPTLGAGVELALAGRLRMIPDVRAQVSITSVILRPSIALGIAF